MKRLVKNSKNAIDNIAPAGSVTTQDKTIVLTELKLIVLAPSTSPIPITAPTNVWVVETGISNWLAITTVSAAALTVVIASQLDMPVSTTHTLVGAVIGIGLVEGASTINFNSVRTIVLSWVVTLPAGAILSIAFLEFFTNLFTY